MAAFLFLVQLLFIGTLIAPAYTETGGYDWVLNATASNFTVTTSPTAYQANTTYPVTIRDNRNTGDSTNVTNSFLQTTSPQNASTGEWSYTVFANTSAESKTVTLNKATETTTLSSVTTHNSVSVVRSSSFFIAVIQLPLLLVTSKLLS